MPFEIPFMSQSASGVAQIMVLVIWAMVGIGVLSWFIAKLSLGREKKELEDVKYKRRTGNSFTEKRVKEEIVGDTLKEAEEGSHLTLRRLQVILDMLANSKGTDKEPQPPHMGDLHQLTEQAITSQSAATWLRIITTTLLVGGICGTLWSVHDVLSSGDTLNNLTTFAPALEPSKWAVAATILLFILRGWYIANVDRFLQDLDKETLIHFLPDLLPSSNMQSVIKDFATAVREFNNDIDAQIQPIQEAIKKIDKHAGLFSQTADDLKATGDGLKEKLNEVTTSCTTIRTNQEQIENSLKKTTELLGAISTSMSNFTILNESLKTQVEALGLQMGNMNTAIHDEVSQLHDSTEKVKDLTTKASSLQAGIDWVQTFAKSAESIQASIDESVNGLRQDSQSFKDGVNAVTQVLNNNDASIRELSGYAIGMTEQTQKLTQAVTNADSTMKAIQMQADTFEGQVGKHCNTMGTEADNMQTAIQNLQSMASHIDQELCTIIINARRVDTATTPNPLVASWKTICNKFASASKSISKFFKK